MQHPDGLDLHRPLSRRLTSAAHLPVEHRAALDALPVRRRAYEADEELIQRGTAFTHAFILEAGWACAYRTLPSGGRQVLSIYLPGDLIGLLAVTSADGSGLETDHSVRAITAAEVSEVDVSELSSALMRVPGLARHMLWDAARAGAILEERIVSLGRRNARERTAHFYLELSERLTLGGAPKAKAYDCPLSQYVVADVLGLSPEHLNRVMRQLRLTGLLCVRRGRVDLLNTESLERLADFDPAYLRTSRAA